ncbi:NAD(P)-binding protein [Aureobasidium pullulans]|uniref:NAD(P)-binding protein n=1 Tax=Aureobasidium pullulans TaxID=5580 RepID=A0A4S9A7R9_AURPU|nr:NAD(P)-binding protein [Aureobasidium pullulans]
MTSVALVGSTGLVGSHILTLLKASPRITNTHAFSRKPLPSSPNLTTIQSSNPSEWPSKYPQDTSVFFSALGTTARIAGSFAAQRKIDYDLNLALATAAKNAGAKIYILISTSGASPTSKIPYAKMKGELDEAVKKLGFEHVVILKPGLLVGEREDSRPGEYMVRSFARALGWISGGVLKDSWAQDADVVARTAVAAAVEVVEGRNGEEVWVLNQREVLRMGRV